MQDIIRMSEPAICGPLEREVVVKKSRIAEIKRTLKEKGFVFVGSGPAFSKEKKKVWFNRIGGL